MYNNSSRPYLDCVTDLRRVAACLLNENTPQAEIFLNHAQSIKDNLMKDEKLNSVLGTYFDEFWNKNSLLLRDGDGVDYSRAAEKFQTLSSILFLKAFYQKDNIDREYKL